MWALCRRSWCQRDLHPTQRHGPAGERGGVEADANASGVGGQLAQGLAPRGVVSGEAEGSADDLQTVAESQPVIVGVDRSPSNAEGVARRVQRQGRLGGAAGPPGFACARCQSARPQSNQQLGARPREESRRGIAVVQVSLGHGEGTVVEFPGTHHRFRFGFANANPDKFDADLLQRLMRHRARQTTQHDIDAAERMKHAQVADRIHVPDSLRAVAT